MACSELWLLDHKGQADLAHMALMERMEAEPRLGTASGKPFFISSSTGRKVMERASRGLTPPTDILVRTRGSRPIGASIVPVRAGGRPSTSARYSRSIRLRASAA